MTVTTVNMRREKKRANDGKFLKLYIILLQIHH